MGTPYVSSHRMIIVLIFILLLFVLQPSQPLFAALGLGVLTYTYWLAYRSWTPQHESHPRAMRTRREWWISCTKSTFQTIWNRELIATCQKSLVPRRRIATCQKWLVCQPQPDVVRVRHSFLIEMLLFSWCNLIFTLFFCFRFMPGVSAFTMKIHNSSSTTH